MAENRPGLIGDAGRRRLVALLRGGWPLPGALSGATLGFQLYFRQPGLNTDSAAPLLLASVWALSGMVCGGLLAGLAGGLIERGLRRGLKAGPLRSTGGALLCVIGLCGGLQAPLQTRLPAVLWPQSTPQRALPLRQPAPTPCRQAAPSERRARQAWELECR